MKDFLNQTLISYVPDSTENKFGPLTIKHLPTPMWMDIFCEMLDNDVEEGHESLLFNTVALMVAIGTKS